MDTLDYYADLRAELLTILRGVHSADSLMWWDDTSPNWLTKRKLNDVFKKYVQLAKPLGIHFLTRHNACGNPKHDGLEQIIESDIFPKYWSDPTYKRGCFVFQDSRFCLCPCAKNNQPTQHGVLDELVYPAADKHCDTIAGVLLDISSAIENAEERKPRSGIREYILRAIITLNDAILPISVDEYLEQQRKITH